MVRDNDGGLGFVSFLREFGVKDGLGLREDFGFDVGLELELEIRFSLRCLFLISVEDDWVWDDTFSFLLEVVEDVGERCWTGLAFVFWDLETAFPFDE